MTPCDCMTVEQADGSSRCRQCRGDWYACECPLVHFIRCPQHHDAPDGASNREGSSGA